MMPLAPVSADLPTGQKPKIGFSIDSIVGDKKGGESQLANNNKSRDNNRSQRTPPSSEHCSQQQRSATPSPEPSCVDYTEKSSGELGRGSREIMAPFTQLRHHHHQLFNHNERFSSGSNPPLARPIPIQSHHHHHQLHYPPLHHLLPPGSHSSSENSSPGIASPSSNNIPGNNPSSSVENKGESNNDRVVTTSSPVVGSTSNDASRSPSPQTNECRKSPLSSSPGIGASLSAQGPNAGIPPPPPLQHPALGQPGLQFGGYPPSMLNFAAAAAAAAVQAHHHPHPGMPGFMAQHHPPPHHPHPAAAHPLYPWLLAKQARFFPHRFGPGPDLPGFLLQPFRKPKRIRTAFSPSQLLKLEHAFERNHYVVGAERKQLANSLSLSETQVKVWFQNRRTKHKRIQQEEDSVKKSGGSSGNGTCGSNSAISADSSTRNYAEMSDDEEIIMDEEYTDDEEEMEHLQQSLKPAS